MGARSRIADNHADARRAASGPDRLRVTTEGWWFGLVAAVTLVSEFVVLQLWRANMSLPFQLGGDATAVAASAKGMIESGWIWFNPHLGAPGVTNTLDFPNSDLLHLLILKLLSLSGDSGLTVNLYYLLSFPLIALAAAWALRRFGVSRSAALAASVLYAFLPYHLYRSELHLFLSGYFMVPLVVWLCLGLVGPRPPLLVEGPGKALQWGLSVSELWLPVAICVLAASSGIYHAVFGGFFLVVAAAYGWWRTHDSKRMVAGLVLVGVMLLTVVVNVAPTLWYQASGPANTGAIERSSTGAELYSLRTALMVLPVRGHRVGLLAQAHEAYVNGLKGISPTMDNESDAVSLGIIGTLGFIFLLLLLLFGLGNDKARAPGISLLQTLAVFTGAALLLANAGMFATIIGVVFSLIRAYNRIVVFVAFFALTAAAYAVDRIGHRFSKDTRVWALPVLATAVLIMGLFDQTSLASVPPYQLSAREITNLRPLVEEIEDGLDAGAMVFQLPYVPYPESPPVVAMLDYDHLKPYLVSSDIHWSYGAVKGREDARWNAEVSEMPTDRMVSTLAEKGFAGVWIDRAGYADQGAEVLKSFSAVTHSEPTMSGDGRYAYFRIAK